MEKTIHVSLDMTPDEITKAFREGDHYVPDPTGMTARNLVSDFRDYTFEIERHNGTIFNQKIEKYPFIYYLIRDPSTNRYFTNESLADFLISHR